jgi:hypothetical protein
VCAARCYHDGLCRKLSPDSPCSLQKECSFTVRCDNAVTAGIASPEMWEQAGIGLETDIYAFGIVMYRLRP